MTKVKYRTTNWKQYNQALVNRGSITFWIDEEAISSWLCTQHCDRRGRRFQYSDTAITTALMLKSIFKLTLRSSEGFLNSIFSLMKLPLRFPGYTCISKRAKIVNISIKMPIRGEICHLAIDSTGLKVFGEGEWKMKKHGKEKRRVWRKLHIAVDADTHQIVAAELSLSSVTDGEVLPNLLKQTHRKIKAISGDGAYDTRRCYEAIAKKKASPLIPPRTGAAYWEHGHPRNRGVANQRIHGSNEHWKKVIGYHKRSLSETAMFRYKTLINSSLTLRDYNAQVGEVYTAIRAMNKLTRLGMPVTQAVR
ncbi:IS5 family transposase [Photobacterium lipolyticum]|uniref:IS5/IS1182 family transposase n=1 Tax=Photobacterium lipolyticum TaxID=266810 RepID=A0A2T3N1D0_9GAMM|nr:IS5 family transposase [Photobacterium lipolyticum]PSW06078.1 IS5/IS1182 family transposase [Photobacterium lipolyticum]